MAGFRSFAALVVIAATAACAGGGGGGGGGTVYQTLTVTITGTGNGTVTSSPAGISCSSGTCNASFAQGTAVTLTAAAAGNGSTFAGWLGPCTAGGATCQLTMSGNAGITATFDPPAGVTKTLTVTIAGSGSGTVTSTPTGLSCSSGTCSAVFSQGTSVTLAASATGGGTFTWGGACASAGTETCAVTMDVDRSVTATFTAPGAQRTLSVTLSGPGGGTVTSTPPGINCAGGTCTAQFADGVPVTLTATPSSGSAFDGWSGACTGTGTCQVTLTADASVTATFSTVQTLTVTLAGDGAGMVTSEPPGISCATGSSAGCIATFPTGTTVTLTGTPAASSSFLGWAPTCDASNAPCTFDLGSSTTLTASFSLWIVHRPFPTWLRGAAQLGSTLVAVGDGSAWLTSTDGISWTGHELPGAPPLRGVAAGGGVAVAVGDGTAGQGTILTTTDAVSWTLRTSNTAFELFGVAHGGGTFVAVGKGGAIVSSTDGGASWTARTSNTSRDLLAVAYGSGTFVATGYAGTILTSTNGADWTSRASSTTEYLAGVAYGPAGFIAVGSAGVVRTSSDGSAWTVQPATGSAALVGITATASSYVAVDSGLNVFFSPSGASWTSRALPQYWDPNSAVAALGSDLFFLGSGGGVVRSADGGASWTAVVPQSGIGPHADQLYDAAYGASTFVVVGDYGAVFTSPDAAVWTARLASPNCNITSVVYGNGAFVANSSAGILRSTDGIAWSAVAAGPSQWGGAVRYAAGKGFVAMGASGSDTAVMTSPDGLAWTTQPSITGKTLYSLAYGASRFVAVGTQGAIYSNADPASGAGWTPEASPTIDWLDSVTFGNGTFVAIDRTNGYASYTSPDGMTWTTHTSATRLPSILAFGDGVFRMSTLTSTDGVTWIGAPVPAIPGEQAGFGSGLGVAAWGGASAGWVGARSFYTQVMVRGGYAFFAHP